MIRNLVLAAAAVGALSVTAMTPTTADAGYWGHKHGHHWRHHHYRPYAYTYYRPHGCFVKRKIWTDYGWRWRTVNVCY